MFEPPPGLVDLLGDAADAPPLGDPAPIAVPDVGPILARRPRPVSLATLAMIENPDLKPDERKQHLAQFVADHLGPGEYDRLTLAMIDGQLPVDTFQKVSQAIAVQGTARPYIAVIILTVTTAQHWREIRRRIHAGGIVDPMRLPSMHAVLEVTENAVIESMRGDDADLQRTRFYDRLYAPPRAALTAGKGTPPPGFSRAEVDAQFDSFMESMG